MNKAPAPLVEAITTMATELTWQTCKRPELMLDILKALNHDRYHEAADACQDALAADANAKQSTTPGECSEAADAIRTVVPALR